MFSDIFQKKHDLIKYFQFADWSLNANNFQEV